jgi:hypothetical protein
MQPKRLGIPEFPIIDAFSSYVDNVVVVECNYCDNYAVDDTEAEKHFCESHRDIYDDTYPKKHLDDKTGKLWFIPRMETVQHDIRELTDGTSVVKFNGLCSYDTQPLNDIELKAVQKQPDGTYIYKEELLLPKEFPKLPKSPRAVKDPKSDKIKHVYSYNVGAAKVVEVKKKLVEQGVQEKDIYTKENKKGNYYVYYFK